MRETLSRALANGLGVAFWLVLGVVAVVGWYATARGLALSWGLRDAATGLGLLAGTAVAVTMWRWARSEQESTALEVGACPRCRTPIEARHEHARPGSSMPGVTTWTCAACDYERSRTLTCPACAA